MSDIEKRLDEQGLAGVERDTKRTELFSELRHRLWVLRGSPSAEEEAATHKRIQNKVTFDVAEKNPDAPLQ